MIPWWKFSLLCAVFVNYPEIAAFEFTTNSTTIICTCKNNNSFRRAKMRGPVGIQSLSSPVSGLFKSFVPWDTQYEFFTFDSSLESLGSGAGTRKIRHLVADHLLQKIHGAAVWVFMWMVFHAHQQRETKQTQRSFLMRINSTNVSGFGMKSCTGFGASAWNVGSAPVKIVVRSSRSKKSLTRAAQEVR